MKFSEIRDNLIKHNSLIYNILVFNKIRAFVVFILFEADSILKKEWAI